MTDQHRPPVEPLSDVAWARVERGLWARMDEAPPDAVAGRPRRWPWIVAPALAAAAVVAILIATRLDPPGEAAPVRLVSGGSPSSVTFGDAHVTLDAQTAVVMSIDSAVVERGGAWFAIVPRGSRPRFVVTAGDAVVRVVGTRFHVARSEEHAVVEVEHGLVDVQFRGRRVEVGAGQRWRSEHPTEVESPKTATAEPPPAPAPEPPVVDPTPPPKPDVDPARRKPRPPAPAPAVDDQTRFHQMQALEVRDPDTAIAGYLELARGTARWAELSLFAAARLAADRNDPRARRLLEQYLRRFPRGANTDDVRELLAHLGGPR